MTRMTSCLATVFGILFSVVSPALAGPYVFHTIDVPGASLTLASGINNPGQIVGSYLDAGGVEHGFLRSGGSFTTIDAPGAVFNQAVGINDAGQIVGNDVDAGGVQHGYLRSGGGFRTVDAPGAVLTLADGINNAGQIVGWYEDTGSSFHGYLLSGGRFSTLDFPGAALTRAFDINNAGQIVGAYNNMPRLLLQPRFFWRAGAVSVRSISPAPCSRGCWESTMPAKSWASTTIAVGRGMVSWPRPSRSRPA
jgi:probable HAF family extracellular repeat protein